MYSATKTLPITPKKTQRYKPARKPYLITLKITELQRAYPGDLPDKKVSDIIRSFFTHTSTDILEGNTFHFPLGAIRIARFKHHSRRIDKYKVKHPELFDDPYNSKMYTDILIWDSTRSMPHLNKYNFLGTYWNNRAIPKYEDKRNFNRATGNATL